jgi:hypothetical protein
MNAIVREVYLQPGDDGAFQDWTKQTKPVWAEQECLRCQGYGGWNMLLNQYPRQEHARLRHFRAHCANCNGRGWTAAEDHIHVWMFHEQQTISLHTEKCSICKRIQQIDSGD